MHKAHINRKKVGATIFISDKLKPKIKRDTKKDKQVKGTTELYIYNHHKHTCTLCYPSTS